MADFTLSDIPDLPGVARTQNQQRNDLMAKLTGGEQDFLGRYTGAIAGQEPLSAMYSRIGQELGVPQLQQNAGMLRNTLTNLPFTWGSASRGFDVNANQLQRIIAQKSSELTPLVNTAESALGTAQTNLSTRMGLGQAEQNKQLLPFGYEKDIIAERGAREVSGFDAGAENELNALISKANMGITLSEGEKNRANQLAMAEKQYQTQLEIAKINSATSKEVAQINNRPDISSFWQ